MATENPGEPKKHTRLKGILVGCLALLLACLALYGLVLYWEGRSERYRIGYLARVGHVPATSRAVEGYLGEVFPIGMTRNEVIQTLGERFVYKLLVGSDGHQLPTGTDRVAFPTPLCSEDEFWERKCGVVVYLFRFQEDALVAIEREYEDY